MRVKKRKMNPKFPPEPVPERGMMATAVAVMVALCMMASPCVAARIAVGDTLPAMSAKTLSGIQYDRSQASNKAVVIAFLSTDQKASQLAAGDLQRIIPSYKDHRRQLDVIVVMDDPVVKDLFQNVSADPNNPVHMIHDDQRQWRGNFHIIAAPTVVIADASGKVTSVIAGYGYDFVPSFRFHLNEALGIEQQITADEVGKVKTLQNKTDSAKIQRHLKMAKMLQDKGKIQASLQQLQLAYQLDPNDLQVLLQIGTLHCRQNQPDQAIKILAGKQFTTTRDQAESELIVGWANRLAGNSELAITHLNKAIELDPASARAFFELGQVYEAASQTDLALKAYKQALSVLLKDG